MLNLMLPHTFQLENTKVLVLGQEVTLSALAQSVLIQKPTDLLRVLNDLIQQGYSDIGREQVHLVSWGVK